MKYGHFSQKEVNEIALLLEKNGIFFNVYPDPQEFENIQKEVKESSPFNYLLGASLNADILVIEIEETEWKKASSSLVEELKEKRIFQPDSIPSEFENTDFSSNDFSKSHRALQNTNKVKVIGVSQLIQLAILLLLLGVYLLFRF